MAYSRADHTDKRSDEARWAENGGKGVMSLEQRAEFVAGANSALRPGGTKWRLVRDRALQQLREVAEAARGIVGFYEGGER